MRQNERQKRNFIIIGLCAIVAIMAVGFAAFSQQLTINSTSEVTSTWCVGFDNTKTNTMVKVAGLAGATEPTGSITYGGSTCGTISNTSASLSASFKQPGDSIEYTLTILNEGTLPAAIKSIKVGNDVVTSNTTVTEGNVKFTVNMPASTSIAAGSSTTMKVVATFQNDTDITTRYSGERQELSVEINAEQDNDSGGITPAPETYTGTIYRWSTVQTENNTTSIVPVTKNVWCLVGKIEGNGYNSCTDENSGFDEEQECLAVIENAINEGYIQDGDVTCQQGTIEVGSALDDYIKEEDYPTASSRATALGKNYYLKHEVTNDIITDSYVCFVKNGSEHCLKGSVDECLWDNALDYANRTCTYTGTTPVFNANKSVLQTAFTEENACHELSADQYHCSVSELQAGVYSDGYVSAGAGPSNPNLYCMAGSNGYAQCYECDLYDMKVGKC